MISFSAPPEGFRPKFEVVSCFVEHGGKLLFLLRQEHKSEPNTYGSPAGKVSEGESLADAMRRELFEETGISAEATYLRTAYVTYPSYQFTYHVYRLRMEGFPEITINPEEHASFAWMTPEEALRSDLIPDMDEVVREFYCR